MPVFTFALFVIGIGLLWYSLRSNPEREAAEVERATTEWTRIQSALRVTPMQKWSWWERSTFSVLDQRLPRIHEDPEGPDHESPAYIDGWRAARELGSLSSNEALLNANVTVRQINRRIELYRQGQPLRRSP